MLCEWFAFAGMCATYFFHLYEQRSGGLEEINIFLLFVLLLLLSWPIS